MPDQPEHRPELKTLTQWIQTYPRAHRVNVRRRLHRIIGNLARRMLGRRSALNARAFCAKRFRVDDGATSGIRSILWREVHRRIGEMEVRL